jgi:hypothetical protein
MMKHRAFAAAGLVMASLFLSAPSAPHASHGSPSVAAIRMTVYKDPNCGCCHNWVEYMRKHDFDVVVRDTSDMSGAKSTGRVPARLQTCHTAFVNGYVVEGHVPAADVKRMLAEKPRIAGIAVAGMPIGSPGMEVGTRVDKYDVIAFNRDGTTQIFARH